MTYKLSSKSKYKSIQDRTTARRERYLHRLAFDQGYKCALCHESILKEYEGWLSLTRDSRGTTEINLDHIIPVSLGGGNNFENFQVTHRLCNLIRGNKLIHTPPVVETETVLQWLP